MIDLSDEIVDGFLQVASEDADIAPFIGSQDFIERTEALGYVFLALALASLVALAASFIVLYLVKGRLKFNLKASLFSIAGVFAFSLILSCLLFWILSATFSSYQNLTFAIWTIWPFIAAIAIAVSAGILVGVPYFKRIKKQQR